MSRLTKPPPPSHSQKSPQNSNLSVTLTPSSSAFFAGELVAFEIKFKNEFVPPPKQPNPSSTGLLHPGYLGMGHGGSAGTGVGNGSNNHQPLLSSPLARGGGVGSSESGGESSSSSSSSLSLSAQGQGYEVAGSSSYGRGGGGGGGGSSSTGWGEQQRLAPHQLRAARRGHGGRYAQNRHSMGGNIGYGSGSGGGGLNGLGIGNTTANGNERSLITPSSSMDSISSSSPGGIGKGIGSPLPRVDEQQQHDGTSLDELERNRDLPQLPPPPPPPRSPRSPNSTFTSHLIPPNEGLDPSPSSSSLGLNQQLPLTPNSSSSSSSRSSSAQWSTIPTPLTATFGVPPPTPGPPISNSRFPNTNGSTNSVGNQSRSPPSLQIFPSELDDLQQQQPSTPPNSNPKSKPLTITRPSSETLLPTRKGLIGPPPPLPFPPPPPAASSSQQYHGLYPNGPRLPPIKSGSSGSVGRTGGHGRFHSIAVSPGQLQSGKEKFGAEGGGGTEDDVFKDEGAELGIVAGSRVASGGGGGVGMTEVGGMKVPPSILEEPPNQTSSSPTPSLPDQHSSPPQFTSSPIGSLPPLRDSPQPLASNSASNSSPTLSLPQLTSTSDSPQVQQPQPLKPFPSTSPLTSHTGIGRSFPSTGSTDSLPQMMANSVNNSREEFRLDQETATTSGGSEASSRRSSVSVDFYNLAKNETMSSVWREGVQDVTNVGGVQKGERALSPPYHGGGGGHPGSRPGLSMMRRSSSMSLSGFSEMGAEDAGGSLSLPGSGLTSPLRESPLSYPWSSSSPRTTNRHYGSRRPNHTLGVEKVLWSFAQLEGSFEVDESLIKPNEFVELKKALFRGGFGGGIGGGAILGSPGLTGGPSGHARSGSRTGLGGSGRAMNGNSGTGTGSGAESSEELVSTGNSGSGGWMGWLWGSSSNGSNSGVGGEGTRSGKEWKGGGSLEERKREAMTNKGVPVFSTPPSVLAVDLDLEPGEEKIYTYSIRIPADLPPSFRGKSIKFSYHLSVGTNRSVVAGGPQISRVLRVPVRVYNHVGVTGARPFYDLTNPIISHRDEAQTTCIGEGGAPRLPEKRKPSGQTDYESYARRLLESLPPDLLSPNPSILSPTAPLPQLSPELNPLAGLDTAGPTQRPEMRPRPSDTLSGSDGMTHLSVAGGKEGLEGVFEEERVGCKAAVEIVTRNSSKASFDINKDGFIVATLTLVKSAYRLGETVNGVVGINSAEGRVLRFSARLETHELIETTIATKPAPQIRQATKRIHAEHHESTLDTARTGFALSIPSGATPDFATSGVKLQWSVRLSFQVLPPPARRPNSPGPPQPFSKAPYATNGQQPPPQLPSGPTGHNQRSPHSHARSKSFAFGFEPSLSLSAPPTMQYFPPDTGAVPSAPPHLMPVPSDALARATFNPSATKKDKAFVASGVTEDDGGYTSYRAVPDLTFVPVMYPNSQASPQRKYPGGGGTGHRSSPSSPNLSSFLKPPSNTASPSGGTGAATVLVPAKVETVECSIPIKVYPGTTGFRVTVFKG